MMLSLLATGCGESGPLHAGTHAEGVDVPLSLDVAITRRPTSDYHAKHWQIHVQVVLTYRGDRQVWASNCHITGRDASGRALFGDVVGHHPLTLLRAPPGLPVDSGRSMPNFSTIGPVGRRRAATLRTLSEPCDAYVWHGQPPI
jgi:hypothetical protein